MFPYHSVHSLPKSFTYFFVPSHEATSGNEQMFKALNDIYTPVLKLMELFESYDGHTNLKQFEHVPAAKHIFLQIYCGSMMFL